MSRTDQRSDYIKRLRAIAHGLSSPNAARVAESRRQMGTLRRSFTPAGAVPACEIVFTLKNPPTGPSAEHEVPIWLLVGGLFALHPQRWTPGRGRRSLGDSLGQLNKPNGERRLTQLLGRSNQNLNNDLRQCVRLLANHDIPVHYEQLLDDLIVLLGPDHRGDEAASVRLRWAGEFYQATRSAQGKSSSNADVNNDSSEKKK